MEDWEEIYSRVENSYICFDSLIWTYIFTESVASNCHWEDYGAWSGCSKDCGGGFRTRYRVRRRLNTDENLINDVDCAKLDTQTETCNRKSCEGMISYQCYYVMFHPKIMPHLELIL